MKKYKKYKDNPEYEFVPYSNNPQYAMGGSNSNKLHKFGQFAGNAISFATDTLLTEVAPNAIKQDQYDDTAFGRSLGKAASVHEGFSSQSPLGKIASNWTTPGEGMSKDQAELYNKSASIAKPITGMVEQALGTAFPVAKPVIAATNAMNKNPSGQIELSNYNSNNEYDPNWQNNQKYMSDELPTDTMYAMGGMYQGQPNAEVEKQEVMQMPDGTTEQVDGYSHENGGVPVNLPQATRIFSDRLKMGKKTFAKVAQRYKTNKEEAILEDTTSNSLQKKTAELNMFVKNKILDKIFNIQEFIKSKKINRYIKRYGGTQMYPHGGTHNLPKYPLGDTYSGGLNPDSGLGNIQDLTFNQAYPDFGPGTQSRYDIRQIMGQSGYPKTSIDPNSIQKFNPKSRYSDYINTFEPNKSLQNFSELSPDSGLGNSPDLTFDQAFKNRLSNNSEQVINYARNSPGLLPGSTKPYQDPRMYPNTTEPESSIGKRDSNPGFYSNNKEMLGQAGTEIGLGLLNNAGNLAYLAQNGKKYDKVDYGQVTPNYLTDRESQNAIREGYSTAAYNLRNSGQQTQAGQISLGNERMKQSANSKERIGNINAQIANQGAYANQGYKIQGMQDEAGNKGVANTNYYTALNSIGQNVASQRGDYLSGQMDQKKLNLIKDYFPDYELDPKTFQYMYKSALQQSKIKK